MHGRDVATRGVATMLANAMARQHAAAGSYAAHYSISEIQDCSYSLSVVSQMACTPAQPGVYMYAARGCSAHCLSLRLAGLQPGTANTSAHGSCILAGIVGAAALHRGPSATALCVTVVTNSDQA